MVIDYAGVNPTHVGMNRFGGYSYSRATGKPHARGDEPAHYHWLGRRTPVNPTHVGMNRWAATPTAPWWRKPHARGDEPYANADATGGGSVNPTHVGGEPFGYAVEYKAPA